MKLTAEEFVSWAVGNIHPSNWQEWRLFMTLKINETKVKALTAKQVKAIDLFVGILKSKKFYNGFGAQIRLEDIEKVAEKIKKLRKAKNETKRNHKI